MRRFGVEIEAKGLTRPNVVELLNLAGIPAYDAGYSHRTSTTQWKVVSDASLTGMYTFEVVSPILEGEDGFAQLKKVCEVLNRAGAGVNKSCGIHVHIDAAGLTKDWVWNVVDRYFRYVETIDSFMPASRRKSNNKYCKDMRKYNIDELKNATTIQEMAGMVEVLHRYSDHRRYRKVNLQAYLRHGTIEFRQHSGSLNYTKISNWIKFCDQFVSSSKPGSVRTSSTNNGRRYNMTRKMREIYESMHYYRTYASLASEFGMAEKSIRAYITKMRSNGTQIEKVYASHSKAYYYRVVGDSEVSSETQRTVDPSSDSLWRGIDPNIVTYYNNRIAALAA